MLKIILFIIFFPITFPIWIIGKFFSSTGNGPDPLDGYDKETELEREMDQYGLEDWQKDLVRKGITTLNNLIWMTMILKKTIIMMKTIK